MIDSILSFAWKYLVGPIFADASGGTAAWNGIVAESGYNIFNTVFYGLSALVSLYIILNYLKDSDLVFNSRTAVFSTPFILLGGMLRFIEDAALISEPFRIFLITPLVYILVGLAYFSSLFLSEKLSELYNYSRDQFLVFLGSTIVLLTLIFIFPFLLGRELNFWSLAGLGISLILTSAFYWLVEGSIYDSPVYVLVVFSQFFGGSVSMVSVMNGGYTQKQLLAGTATTLFGFPGIMIVKLGVISLAVHLLSDMDEGVSKAIAILVLTAVGLGTGLRVFLRFLTGL